MERLNSDLARSIAQITNGHVSWMQTDMDLLEAVPVTEYADSRTSLVRKCTISYRVALSVIMTVATKTAAPGASNDLIQQARDLLDMSPAQARHFPVVLGAHLDEDPPYYVMKYCPFPSLRNLIMQGEIEEAAACSFLSNALDFLFREIYPQEATVPPSDFLENAHLNRLSKRLSSLASVSPGFASLIDADTIQIGRRSYKNIKPLLSEIGTDKRLTGRLQPLQVNRIHGDLELDHILVNIQGDEDIRFILLDPRFPAGGSDIAYDMGKLRQSTLGHLDSIAAERFDLGSRSDNGRTVSFETFVIHDPAVISLLKELDKAVLSVLPRYEICSRDVNLGFRTAFSTAVHVASSGPFYLKRDGLESVATALYLRGVQLLNDFVADC